MSKHLLSAATVVIALFGAAVARAQTPPTPPWVAACEGDIKKLCEAEVKAKQDERPCLAKNEDKLSQTCKDVFLAKYKALEICKDDIAKVCGGGSDGRALGKCFNEKFDQLGEKCRTALSRIKKQSKKDEPAAAPGKAEKPAKPAKKAAAEKPATETPAAK